MVAAAAFFEGLADVNVATDVTERMLTTVARDIRAWLDLGIPVQHVGINVSSADFSSGALAAKVAAAFAAWNVPLKHAILEVTEEVYLGRREQNVAQEIKVLREKGLRIALDDFGTGYASLTHLLTVPVRIVAEGIETESQAAQLLAAGCQLGQGYLFSEAVDRDAATELLQRMAQARPDHDQREGALAQAEAAAETLRGLAISSPRAAPEPPRYPRRRAG